MKFSVLIPVYNTEKYLEECLQSVLNQTYQDFEIILVDDGSIDNSGAICDRYHTDYSEKIKVIHQENSGQFVSRVNAIREATADYCVFLDADDLLLVNTIETICNCLLKNGYPDMVFFPFWYDRNGVFEKSRLISDKSKLFLHHDMTNLREQFFSDILLNNMWTKVVKREVLLSSVYDYESYASLRCAEDRLQAMWILDNINSAYYLNIPLYQYRLFEGSTTRTYSLNNIEKYNIAILYSEEKKYLFKWGFDTNEWLERFQAGFITYLVCVFDLFYMNVKKEEKTMVINYDWCSFIPDEIVPENIEKNGFIPDLQKNILSWILTKNESKIKRYYTRKKSYQKLRKVKRKFIR